jgi:subtilisin family serine protease
MVGVNVARRLAVAVVVGSLGIVAPEVQAAATVDDPGFDLQWGLALAGIPTAWEVATGQGTIIAIVDSGIDREHEDLRDKLAPARLVSCLGTGGNPNACTAGGADDGRDDVGHGTHVAGIAAASADNGRGVAGVAPGADLMALKVLHRPCPDCEAVGDADDVSAAMRYAVDHGADVINLSVGNTVQSVFGPAFEAAIRYAWDNGVLAVVAAGNGFVLPSGFDNEPALVVAALNSGGRAATYSNGVGFARWALSAPGGEVGETSQSCNTDPVGVVSTYWDGVTPNLYSCLAGTSMAAPFVAGAAAVLRSAGLAPLQVVERLLGTADDLGFPGRDLTYGAGALDLRAATADLAPATSTTAPTVAPDDTAPPASDPAPQTTAPPPPTAPATTEAPAPVPPSDAVAPALPDNSGGAATDTRLTSSHEPLPSGLVTLAVLLVVAVATGHGWWVLRVSGWARRTPLPPD